MNTKNFSKTQREHSGSGSQGEDFRRKAAYENFNMFMVFKYYFIRFRSSSECLWTVFVLGFTSQATE